MNERFLAIVAAVALALFVIVSPAAADTLKLKDGSSIEGVIKKVEAGKVYVAIKDETKVLSILDVDTMDFNTPHLLADMPNLPAEHFMKNTEAQEIVRNMQELDKAAVPDPDLLGWQATDRSKGRAGMAHGKGHVPKAANVLPGDPQ
jgi:hypothetical protein